MAKNPLVIICGPTATGKTSLGIRLAKEFEGEIISADSRQVYRGMDIGTGKDIAGGVWRTVRRRKEEESQGHWEVEEVPIHLLDLVNPNEEFSVSHYYRLAWHEIRRLWGKKKLPLLVGGTGFYIRAVVDGVETRAIPRNLKIRAKIEGWSVEKLFDYLTKIDPEKAALMNWSDKNNSRRLVRAIEVAIFRQDNPTWRPSKHQNSDSLFIGLTAPRQALYQRIDERVDERLRLGIEEEVRELLDKGYKWESSALGNTIGYKEWQPYFERQRKTRFPSEARGSYFKGKATKEEVIQRWKFNEHSYARRQVTWFKKEKRIRWFDITQPGFEQEVVKKVGEWYSKNGAKKD